MSATTIVHAQTVEFNASVNNDSSNQGVTWAVSGEGCVGDTCGTISHSEPFHAHYTAPANPTAMRSASIVAKSVKDPTKSALANVTVWPHLTINTGSVPGGIQRNIYTATVQNNGGMPPLQWVVSSGILPAGLTLNAATGIISGNADNHRSCQLHRASHRLR